MAKNLSEFLGVPEGVEFKIDGMELKYKILDNILFYYDKFEKVWYGSDFSLNNIASKKITILPKQILTDEEKEYLSAVIKPYGTKSVYQIFKRCYTDYCYVILILISGLGQPIQLPCTSDLAFKDMEVEIVYKLSNLGLEE